MRLTTLAALLLAVALPLHADDTKSKHKNRLAKETSPYLLMHAHNPTDWYAWGPEAFEKAKKENKLVFLSIGYSSCYWCHVMERESFNHDEVAKILNESFVCIKVDREERPDIDNIYMTALQQLRSSTGWPLSMFLLPDGRPIVGGTYWPREDKKEGDEVYRGFKSILKIMKDGWKDDPKGIEAQAEKLSDSTNAALQRTMIALIPIDRKLVDEVAEALADEFDPEYGGFGSPERKFKGTKFPMPARLDFLLKVYERTKKPEHLKMVTTTLDRMAQGGIYDQLGGGFHRYSTERTWTVPHFEKMLYDNAQLVEVYSRAFVLTKNPMYRRIVAETLAYVEREMMSPAGALYSSQDAETHHEEGRFYVWTPAELKEALPDAKDYAQARTLFGLDDKLNFEGKYHILTLPKEPDTFEPVRKKLWSAREKRDKPLRNEIALTSWSGEMIAGFAVAGKLLDEPKYVETAKKAAEFVLKHQRTADGRLLRTYGAAPGQAPKASVAGYAEDYAFLVHGLLALHDATGDARWLKSSQELTDTLIKHHGDQRGGVYFTAHDHEKLFARSKDQYDGAQPSANSIHGQNLVELWKRTGEEKYKAEAEKTFKVFAAPMKGYPPGLAGMARAMEVFLDRSGTNEK